MAAVAAEVLQGPMVVKGVVEVEFQGPEEEGAVVPQEPKEAAVAEAAAEGRQLRTWGTVVVVAAAAAVVPMFVAGVMVGYASAEGPVPASRLWEQVVARGDWTSGLSVEAKEAEVWPEAVRAVVAGEHGFSPVVEAVRCSLSGL